MDRRLLTDVPGRSSPEAIERRLVERRRAARRTPGDDEPVARLRLRGGAELRVVELSNSGALVEGGRLLPGTHVDVHVITPEGRVLVRSRVVRVFVCHVEAEAVRYRGALAFERTIDTSPIAIEPEASLGERLTA